MSQPEIIEIALSRKKLALMLGGALLFIVCGFWFVINPPVIKNPFFGNPAMLFAVGVLAIIFFGLCAVIAVRKLLDNTPGLIVSEQGLIDNSSGVSAGIVPWSDILEIKKQSLMNQNFLIVIVKNPEAYLSRQKNPLKRKTMEINLKSYGSPITVSANTLQIGFDELAALIGRKFDEKKSLR